MNTWRRLQLPLSTPTSIISSSIYYSHPPLPLPSLLCSIQHRLHELLQACEWVHHHHHPMNMLYGRSLEIEKVDLLQTYRVVVLSEKWRGEEDEDEDRNSIRWTDAVWLCLQANHAYHLYQYYDYHHQHSMGDVKGCSRCDDVMTCKKTDLRDYLCIIIILIIIIIIYPINLPIIIIL